MDQLDKVAKRLGVPPDKVLETLLDNIEGVARKMGQIHREVVELQAAVAVLSGLRLSGDHLDRPRREPDS